MSLHVDPPSRPDPDEERRLRTQASRVEYRPKPGRASLATRSLACPSCSMPVELTESVGWTEPLACAFCEGVAPTRAWVRERGWPEVVVNARLDQSG